jgi:hypothetical protein
MSEKVFINGVFINEHVFQDGGSILKVNIPADKVDALAEQLKRNAADGWVRLVIGKNRQPTISAKTGKAISTHSLSVDTWKPKQQQDVPHRVSAPAPAPNQADDIPF